MIESQWKPRRSNFILFYYHLQSQFRAETEAKVTEQKDEEIKNVEAEILQLKSDIYNLKVSFTVLS